jgi:hypothetical protein
MPKPPEALTATPESVLTALVYLLPGFLAYALVYRSLVPARKESDLSLSAKSLLWSLALDAVMGLYGGVRGYAVSFSSPGTIAWALVLAVASGFALAKLRQCGPVASVIGGVGADGTWHATVWQELLHAPSAHKSLPIFVEMNDGVVYEGEVRSHTNDPNDAIRELVLGNAYLRRRGWDDEEPLSVDGDVYIPLSSIKTIVRQSVPSSDSTADEQ